MKGDTFATRDLQLAATLVALGHKPIRLEDHKTKVNTKLFVFDGKGKQNTLEKDVRKYYSRELKIEPNTLFHCNNTLREWVTSEVKTDSQS